MLTQKKMKKIAEYIRTQLQSDIVDDQMTLAEYIDPFTGIKESSPLGLVGEYVWLANFFTLRCSR